MKPAPASTLRQLSWCFVLAVSLLFTQFAGQRHRIDHTPWAGVNQAGQSAKISWSDATHSCIALDAATLADGVCASQLLLAPAAIGATLWLSAALSRELRFIALFRSRAPPRVP
jgi:hypothetical protein